MHEKEKDIIAALQKERDKAHARYKAAAQIGAIKEAAFNLGRATAFSMAISIANGMGDKNEVN